MQTSLSADAKGLSPFSHVQVTSWPPLVSAHIIVCSLHSPNEQRSMSTEQSFPLNPAKEIMLTRQNTCPQKEERAPERGRINNAACVRQQIFTRLYVLLCKRHLCSGRLMRVLIPVASFLLQSSCNALC